MPTAPTPLMNFRRAIMFILPRSLGTIHQDYSKTFQQVRPIAQIRSRVRSKLDGLPSSLTPTNDPSLKPVQAKVRYENNCDEDDDACKERWGIISLRGVQNEVAKTFAGSDVFPDNGSDYGVWHGCPKPKKDLRRRRRQNHPCYRLRPGRPHQASQPHQLFVDRNKTGICVEEYEKEACYEHDCDLRGNSQAKPHNEYWGKCNFGDAIKSNDVGLQRSREKLRSSKNKTERQPNHCSQRVTHRNLGQRDRDVPVDVLMGQQLVQLGGNQARTAEIRQQRVRHSELPKPQYRSENSKLCKHNSKAAETPLTHYRGDLGWLSFNNSHNLIAREQSPAWA